MATIITQSPTEMHSVAHSVLQHIKVADHAAVVRLSGDLGAGKTTLVQAIARELGVGEEVTSPTFVIMKQYTLPESSQGIDMLVHIDAYRIEDPQEMHVLRFEEILKTPHTLVCIEWGERIESLLPTHTIKVDISSTDTENERSIYIHDN